MSEAYGVAMTKQGLALMAKIMASKSSLTLVRVMMGSGEVPEGVYMGDLEDLIEPVAPGTVSEPVYKGSTVEMTVEYRSDMNGGLTEGFIIREFGIFARDGEDEVMILYGNLAERQQYIGPWIEGGGNDVRRYPVSITIAEGTPVILEGLPGTVMTLDDVKDYCVSTLLPQLLTASQNQIVKHNLSEEAHPYLQEQLVQHNGSEQAHPYLQGEIAKASAAAKAAQDAADSAIAAASASAGGCAVRVTFGAGCAGWSYQITDGADETHTGTVPDSLVVEATLKQCATQYTVTAWDGQGNTWTNQITTGPYFGPGSVTVTDFAAVLTVKAAAGAEVTAVCGAQSYRAQADASGEAQLSIGTAGRYTVTAALDGKTVSGFIDVTESKSYRLELGAFREDLNAAPVARSHIVFEPGDWTGNQLRVSRDVHGMEPKQTACVCTLRQRVGRTAVEYDGNTLAQARQTVVAAVSAALNANASAPGSYPTAEDGHILLTWEQLQYFLLEDVLASSSAASAKASELGFGAWKNRDNGVPETVTLDQLLSAAYLPALGGSSANFNGLCTLEALQGLRFRRGADSGGYAAKYDLDGLLTPTWGTLGARVRWDVEAGDLVIDAAPFAGDILVLDSGGASASGVGTVLSRSPSGESEALPVATQHVPGAVKPGPGLTVAADGTLSVDTATVVTSADLADENAVHQEVVNILNGDGA